MATSGILVNEKKSHLVLTAGPLFMWVSSMADSPNVLWGTRLPDMKSPQPRAAAGTVSGAARPDLVPVDPKSHLHKVRRGFQEKICFNVKTEKANASLAVKGHAD